jgi:signal transduction histidine kinase
MKLFSKTMAVAGLLLTLSGIIFFFTWSLDPIKYSASEVAAEIEDAISSFNSTHSQIEKIDLSTIKQLIDSEDLIDPKGMLPTSQQFPLALVSALYNYSNTCDFNEISKINLPASNLLHKTLVWHQFICHKIAALPTEFFEQSPYLHPSGNSFAFLAFSSGMNPFIEPDWISTNSQYFHIIELKEMARDVLLTPTQRLLANSTKDTLSSLANGQKVILDPNFVLVKRLLSERQFAYQAFRRSDWNNYFSEEKFYPTQDSFKIDSRSRVLLCLVREGNICWRPNRIVQIDFRDVAKGAAALGLALVLLNLIGIGIYKVRLERRNHHGRVFVLRTITHELRTPVAGIELSLESFRHHYERLTEDMQLSFMRMCNDVQRLRRLIESSTQYLQSSEDGHLLILKPIFIQSFNDCIEVLLEDYLPNINFHPLKNDRSCVLDPFWVGICVKNLVENALTHGTKPVEVTLKCEYNLFLISVKDQGMNPNLNLLTLERPFSKQSTSPGLGLGISIVVHILKSMKATMHFSPAPTTFTIKLKGSHDKDPDS